MPNYLYKCDSCNFEQLMVLPISIDPSKIFCCDQCPTGNMKRRIIRCLSVNIKRDTLEDWYKKKTGGKELMGEN